MVASGPILAIHQCILEENSKAYDVERQEIVLLNRAVLCKAVDSTANNPNPEWGHVHGPVLQISRRAAINLESSTVHHLQQDQRLRSNKTIHNGENQPSSFPRALYLNTSILLRDRQDEARQVRIGPPASSSLAQCPKLTITLAARFLMKCQNESVTIELKGYDKIISYKEYCQRKANREGI